MKIKCKKCGLIKDENDFYKKKTNKNGYESICKDCKNHKYTHICCICGEEYENGIKNSKYCSKKCYGKSISGENNVNYKPKIECKCDYCGENIELKQSRYDEYNHHFCNESCFHNWHGENMKGENNYWYGKHLTEETKKKLSEANKGKYKGENNYFYGKHFCGENNPRWNPNKTDEEREIGRNYPEYYEWRKQVYERDNYTCQCCGSKKSGKFNAHHIYGYSEHKELRTDINNGITLCEECHKDYHKQYGYVDNNWKDFRTFLYYKWKNTNNLNYAKIIEDIELRLLLLNMND